MPGRGSDARPDLAQPEPRAKAPRRLNMAVAIHLIDALENRRLFSLPIGPAIEDAPAAVGMAVRLSALPISHVEIDLAWTTGSRGSARPGPSTYVIERALGASGTFETLATVDSTPRSFKSTNLFSNTLYRYRIRDTVGTVLSNTAQATSVRIDAGLDSTFQLPSAVTGTTRSILNYGATPNNSSNDDSTAIKNAINASTAGDEVYIPDGVYHLKTRDIKLKTGVSIRGQSQGGTILSAAFTDAGVDNPNSQVFHADPGVNNLTLSKFSIEMSGGQSMQYGFYLGSGGDTAANVSRIAVKEVTVEDFEKFAIAVRRGDNMLVENCTLRNATALGGGGQGYGVMLGYDSTRNCWVKNSHFGPVLRHSVVVQYQAHHNLIEGNVSEENTLDAFDLHGEDEYSNEIRYNTVTGSGGYGIGAGNTGSTHVNSGPNNWIHHNEVSSSRGGVNIILGSNTQFVEDNYFHHNTGDGILVNNGGGSNLFFLRNTIRFNGDDGANVSEAPNLWFEANVITDNGGNALETDAITTGYWIKANDFRFNSAGVILGSVLGIFEDNLQ